MKYFNTLVYHLKIRNVKIQLSFLVFLLFLGACKKEIISSTPKVTTAYTTGVLYGTEDGKDNLIRGFVVGIYDGNVVTVNNNSDVITLPLGKGNFTAKPELKPNTQYYIWAFAYYIGQEDKMGIGNIVTFKTN